MKIDSLLLTVTASRERDGSNMEWPYMGLGWIRFRLITILRYIH